MKLRNNFEIWKEIHVRINLFSVKKKLAVLKKLLDENFKKGHIRSLISSAGYSIIFVFKKDGKLRLCVDYRQLNNITVKNRYILFKIDELFDRVQEAK